MRFLKFILGVGFLIIIGGLIYYQIIRGDYFLQRGRANYIRVVPQQAIRGSIKDRGGKIIAHDRPIFNIAVIPYQIRNQKKEIFRQISQSSEITVNQLEDNYRDNFRSMFAPTDIITDIPKEEGFKLKELVGDQLLIREIPQRYYPHGNYLASVLGYVQNAGVMYEKLKVYGYVPDQRVGFLGIEQYYDSYLQGKDGGQLFEVDSRGRIVGFLGKKIPQRGQDISLTLDSAMQKIAYQSLRGYQGAIIVIDPQQGQIYTLASRPSYDPNRIVTGKSQKIKSDFLNRCIQASYPLGSVFKPLVAITALDNDVIAANKKVFCPGYFKIANSRFNCWSEHGHQDMIQAITHSCNVYFYKLGLKLGIKELSQVAHQFGFGGLTGVDLPYEGDGIVPSRQWKKDYRNQPWYTGDTVNTSIGQGYLQVTPLQATVAMAALANGGYTVKPHLLKAVNDLETTIISKDYLGISNQDLQVVRRGLRGVVAQTSGTAHLLDRLDLAIAGKTGTAQTSGPSHGWFVGYFPQDKPLFTFCVFLENAGSSHQAVRVAYRFLRNLKKAGIIGDNYE